MEGRTKKKLVTGLSLRPVVVIPNLNGGQDLLAAVQSLVAQTLKPHIIIVDNASTDGSVDAVVAAHTEVEIIRHTRNLGYAGGVNPGFKRAIEMGADYVAPFNDDAVADATWLEHLVDFLDRHPAYGMAACKVITSDGTSLDSTGEFYTTWGLPYPRGRGETDIAAYDAQTDIFGASGAASLYRVRMLQEIGLLDEDFFAYYEDVDLSFRAQLAGWKVAYVPQSLVYHKIGNTSKRMRGFTTYQATKNLPWVLWKNVPGALLPSVLPRFIFAYAMFLGRSIFRGHAWYAFKGLVVSLGLLPKKLAARHRIQSRRKVTSAYISSIIVHDLPENAGKLRQLRVLGRKLTGRPT